MFASMFLFFCNVDYTRSGQYSYFIDQFKSWFKKITSLHFRCHHWLYLTFDFYGLWPSKCIKSISSCLKNTCSLWNALCLLYRHKIILSAANISISSAPVEHMLIPNFKDGFLLQWLNPKAWLACVSGITMFTSIENPQSLPIFIVIYFSLATHVCSFGVLW